MAAGLNPAQHEAVNTLKGPLLVLAGAGTGKTRVITYRISNLVRKGTPPDKILAVTFTNKAAREMRERTRQLLGGKKDKEPFISTFHSLCVNILRRHAPRLDYSPKFAIYDRSDQETAARNALREARIAPASLKHGELLLMIGRWKTLGVWPSDAKQQALDEKERLAALAYANYQKSLKLSNALDFDDLLLWTERLFREHPEALAVEQQRFDQVLVDEYQDTSLNQYRILGKLVEPHQNLCVVGDDDQSIYSWRGAEVKNILGFDKDYPNAKVVRLEENYRSCPNILKLANELISRNSERHPKVLRASKPSMDVPRFHKYADEQAEAEAVVRDIAATFAKENVPFRDFAVLFRTNEQPRLFEQEFRARNIPYVLVGGRSFFDRREIRDLLAYCRVLNNPSDEVSLLRILNVPTRGLGQTVAAKIVARAAKEGVSAWSVLPRLIEENTLSSRAVSGLKSFVGLMSKFVRRFEERLSVHAVNEFIGAVDYRDEIARRYEAVADQTARWESVSDFVNMVGQYIDRSDRPTLGEFLEEITLDQEQQRKDEDKKDRNAVTLMTLHSAKGLEFPHVYLVGLEEGILPHERSLGSSTAIAEERRLAYVGVTRAQHRLTMTRALFRSRFGKRQAAAASRFLYEMHGKPVPSAKPAKHPQRSSTAVRSKGGFRR